MGYGKVIMEKRAIYEGEEVAVKKIFRGGEQGKELEVKILGRKRE